MSTVFAKGPVFHIKEARDPAIRAVIPIKESPDPVLIGDLERIASDWFRLGREDRITLTVKLIHDLPDDSMDYNSVFNILFDHFAGCDAICRHNLLDFLTVTWFFRTILMIYRPRPRDMVNVDENGFLLFWSSIPPERDTDRIVIALSLFDLLPPDPQDAVRRYMLGIRASLTPRVTVRAVIRGCLPYDDGVYETLCDWLNEGSISRDEDFLRIWSGYPG